MSKRKSTSKSKLKAASEEKQIQMWKEHFKNLLVNSSKVTGKPIMKIINSRLDITLGQLTGELAVVQTKMKNRKAAGLDEIPTRSMEDKEIQ